MQILAILQMVVLLAAANGTPVIAKKIFRHRFARPLDGGLDFIDGRPLLGTSKTIRGIVASLAITTASAPLVGLSPKIGALVALRRWRATSSRASRSAGSACRQAAARSASIKFPNRFSRARLPAALSLKAADILLVVAIFFVGEIVLSRVLYALICATSPTSARSDALQMVKVISGGQLRRTATMHDPAPTEVYPAIS